MSDRRTTISPWIEERREADRDRRQAQRYLAGGTPVVLTWTEAGQFRTLNARLKDISLSGLAVFSESSPPKGIPIWFRLKDDQTSDWINAAVVGSAKTGLLGLGPRVVRMHFLSPCPYHVFKEAIDGFTHQIKYPDQSLGVYTRRDWR